MILTWLTNRNLILKKRDSITDHEFLCKIKSSVEVLALPLTTIICKEVSSTNS